MIRALTNSSFFSGLGPPSSRGTRESSTHDWGVRERMTLTIDPDLLRGVRLSSILQGFGKLFQASPLDRSPDENGNLWGKSCKCERLDVFISQAWTAPWFTKYVSLVMMFYRRHAFATYILSLTFLCCLDLFRLLPVVQVDTWRGGEFTTSVSVCPWCPVPTMLGFVALFLIPELGYHRTDPIVFFDAVCINQVDEQLKEDGIYSLGGFLANSTQLVVLWSPTYFSRYWCVYEIATFVAVHTAKHIKWCPTTVFFWQLVAHCSALLCVFVDTVCACLGVRPGLRMLIGCTTSIVPMIFCVHLGREYLSNRHQLVAQMEAFDIAHAECREESDRALIDASVVANFGGLDQFNQFVHGPLRESVMPVVKDAGISYSSCFMMCSPILSYSVQWTMALARSGLPAETALKEAAIYLSLSLCAAPLYGKLFIVVCETAHRRRPGVAADRVLSLAIACLLWAFGGGMVFIALEVTPLFRHGELWALAAYVALAIFTFHPWLRESRRRVRQRLRSMKFKSSPAAVERPEPVQGCSGICTTAEAVDLELPGDGIVEESQPSTHAAVPACTGESAQAQKLCMADPVPSSLGDTLPDTDTVCL